MYRHGSGSPQTGGYRPGGLCTGTDPVSGLKEAVETADAVLTDGKWYVVFTDCDYVDTAFDLVDPSGEHPEFICECCIEILLNAKKLQNTKLHFPGSEEMLLSKNKEIEKKVTAFITELRLIGVTATDEQVREMLNYLYDNRDIVSMVTFEDYSFAHGIPGFKTKCGLCYSLYVHATRHEFEDNVYYISETSTHVCCDASVTAKHLCLDCVNKLAHKNYLLTTADVDVGNPDTFVATHPKIKLKCQELDLTPPHNEDIITFLYVNIHDLHRITHKKLVIYGFVKQMCQVCEGDVACCCRTASSRNTQYTVFEGLYDCESLAHTVKWGQGDISYMCEKCVDRLMDSGELRNVKYNFTGSLRSLYEKYPQMLTLETQFQKTLLDAEITGFTRHSIPNFMYANRKRLSSVTLEEYIKFCSHER